MEQNNTDRLKHSAGAFKSSAEGDGINGNIKTRKLRVVVVTSQLMILIPMSI